MTSPISSPKRSRSGKRKKRSRSKHSSKPKKKVGESLPSIPVNPLSVSTLPVQTSHRSHDDASRSVIYQTPTITVKPIPCPSPVRSPLKSLSPSRSNKKHGTKSSNRSSLSKRQRSNDHDDRDKFNRDFFRESSPSSRSSSAESFRRIYRKKHTKKARVYARSRSHTRSRSQSIDHTRTAAGARSKSFSRSPSVSKSRSPVYRNFRRRQSRSRSRSPLRIRKKSPLRSPYTQRAPAPPPPPPVLKVPVPSASAPLYLQGGAPQITRQARRLYVGNLPVGVGLTEQIITEFFKSTSKTIGIATPQPVMSSWLSSEGTFCFVEFRSVQDCTSALSLLEGLQLGGRTLRFGRPVDYKPPPSHLANYVLGHPENPPPRVNVTRSLGNTLQRVPDLPTSNASSEHKNLTKVVVLTNMVKKAELADPVEYVDLLTDIKQECSKYGDLIKIMIPRVGDTPRDRGLGKVFLYYERLSSASRAHSVLDGRAFSGNRIQASFLNERKFLMGDF
eukprot:954194_1